ncbi:unnamed protein product, partial [Prorocentrum cordatum]
PRAGPAWPWRGRRRGVAPGAPSARPGPWPSRCTTAFHKPAGFSSQPNQPVPGAVSVWDLFEQALRRLGGAPPGACTRRLSLIGRLDLATSGLVVFSNYRPMHLALCSPGAQLQKRYRAICAGRLWDGDERLASLRAPLAMVVRSPKGRSSV